LDLVLSRIPDLRRLTFAERDDPSLVPIHSELWAPQDVLPLLIGHRCAELALALDHCRIHGTAISGPHLALSIVSKELIARRSVLLPLMGSREGMAIVDSHPERQLGEFFSSWAIPFYKSSSRRGLDAVSARSDWLSQFPEGTPPFRSDYFLVLDGRICAVELWGDMGPDYDLLKGSKQDSAHIYESLGIPFLEIERLGDRCFQVLRTVSRTSTIWNTQKRPNLRF